MALPKLLTLPAELRDQIYTHLLSPDAARVDQGDRGVYYKYDLQLFRVCKQTYYEARAVFRKQNVFVQIATPWAEAQHHIAIEGNVPIVASGELADRFHDYHLGISLDAPRYDIADYDAFRLIILMQDIAEFCQMWYYSALTYPGLNEHLRLTLTLRNPYVPTAEQASLPKALQQKLLEPFGIVKGLYELRVLGEHDSSVEKALRDAIAVPYPTPEQCLEDATELKDAGNELLKKQQYLEAIEVYRKSFAKMHVVCRGRARSVWGDAFYQQDLRGGKFDGQNGATVRIDLRVRLVANIVLAYLKLEEWDEAHFWGMRSIMIMREAMGAEDGEDQVVTSFVAADAMGKIYYRTALASKELGDKSEARKLLRVAAAYLPHDETIRKEQAAVALRLG